MTNQLSTADRLTAMSSLLTLHAFRITTEGEKPDKFLTDVARDLKLIADEQETSTLTTTPADVSPYHPMAEEITVKARGNGKEYEITLDSDTLKAIYEELHQ